MLLQHLSRDQRKRTKTYQTPVRPRSKGSNVKSIITPTSNCRVRRYLAHLRVVPHIYSLLLGQNHDAHLFKRPKREAYHWFSLPDSLRCKFTVYVPYMSPCLLTSMIIRYRIKGCRSTAKKAKNIVRKATKLWEEFVDRGVAFLVLLQDLQE